VADTKTPSPTVREFALWQLEKIATSALAKAPKCVTNRRVDIERLMQEGYDITGATAGTWPEPARTMGPPHAALGIAVSFLACSGSIQNNAFASAGRTSSR
jgi:hypothetical protein